MSAAWLGHILIAYVGTEWKLIGWKLLILAYIILSKESLLPTRLITLKEIFKLINILFFLLFLLTIPQTQNFRVTQINSNTSLLVSRLPVHIVDYLKGSLHTIRSTSLGLAPAIAYNTLFRLNYLLNFNNNNHLILAINMFITCTGTKTTFYKNHPHRTINI